GLVINSSDTRAYVSNLISRDVSVVDLGSNTEISRIESASLPAPGSLAAIVLHGEELFNTAIGPAGQMAPRHAACRPHVELRLGRLLQLSSERPHRRRHLAVSGWPAAVDLHGEHGGTSPSGGIDD